MSSPKADSIKAVTGLVAMLFDKLGVAGTIVLAVVLLIILLGWSVYQDRKKNALWERMLDGKEKEVQRLANESRHYRVMFLKKDGWSDERIKKLIIENEFSSHRESREAMEGDKADSWKGNAAGRKTKIKKRKEKKKKRQNQTR